MPQNKAAEPLRRCAWAKDPCSVRYHDEEWGRATHNDAKLYELLLLEAFQAGLSWRCILQKREAFRAAFDGFDPHKIAAYGPADIDRLMADAGIVRCRRKIEAAIANARVFLAIQAEFGTFDAYLRTFAPDAPLVNTTDVFPTTSPLSDALSADLRRRGMGYMGSVTVYSYLQAVGVIDDHETGCFLRAAETAQGRECPS